MNTPRTYTGTSEVLVIEVKQFFRLVSPVLVAGEHFKIERELDGIAKLFLRLRLAYPIYAQAVAKEGFAPFSAAALRKYLIASPFFLQDRIKGVRFRDTPDGTSALVFDYDKLRAADIVLTMPHPPA